MRAQVHLFFVLTLLKSVVANIPKKICNDCIAFHSCGAARILLNKNELTADEKLKEAFCGFDNSKNPMLSSSEPTGTVPGSDSVEGHPNLQLLPDRCGPINEDKRLRGVSVDLYQYPWIVRIAYRLGSGLQFKCVGSLINERYVLTAAHCISNLNNLILAGVRVGEFERTTANICQEEPPGMICERHIQDFRIEEAIGHPDYHGKPRIKNDIGLLRLKTPVDFTFKNAGMICLPVTKELQHRKVARLNATIATWEASYESTKLRFIEVPIRTQENCKQMWEMFYTNKATADKDDLVNKLCAGEDGRSTCKGDSGVPLMVKGMYKNLGLRFIQHGLLSYGRTVCGTDVPSVYTEVSKYVKWILDNMKP